MADKKISDMTAASAYTGANEFYEMVQGGSTRQGSHALLKTYFDTLYPTYTAPASVTPVFTGLGTVSSLTAYTWRVGGILHFEITVTPGTTTATELRVGLRYNPGSGEVDVTTASTYPTLQIVGTAKSGAQTANFTVMAEASKTYLCMGKQADGSSAGLVKRNGNDIASSGNVISMCGSVRIQGW